MNLLNNWDISNNLPKSQEKKKLLKWIAPLALGFGLMAIGGNIVDNNTTNGLLQPNYGSYSTNYVENGRLSVHAGSKVTVMYDPATTDRGTIKSSVSSAGYLLQ